MGDPHDDASDSKISPTLAETLPKLRPEQISRIVVLVDMPRLDQSGGARRNGRRAAEFDSMRAAARPALDSIDEILAEHGGRRLADDVDALGSVTVDATPAAVFALSSLSGVRAVLADQPLRGVTTTR